MYTVNVQQINGGDIYGKRRKEIYDEAIQTNCENA